MLHAIDADRDNTSTIHATVEVEWRDDTGTVRCETCRTPTLLPEPSRLLSVRVRDTALCPSSWALPLGNTLHGFAVPVARAEYRGEGDELGDWLAGRETDSRIAQLAKVLRQSGPSALGSL